MRPFAESGDKKAFFGINAFYRRRKKSITLAGITLGAAILAVGISQLAARASFMYFYPSACSGDWENPQNAVGKPDLEMTAAPESFAENNAAILRGGAGQSIFCGDFNGEDVPGRIIRVKLNLSWVFKNKIAPAQPTAPTEDARGGDGNAEAGQVINESDVSGTAEGASSAGSEIAQPATEPAGSPADSSPGGQVEGENLNSVTGTSPADAGSAANPPTDGPPSMPDSLPPSEAGQQAAPVRQPADQPAESPAEQPAAPPAAEPSVPAEQPASESAPEPAPPQSFWNFLPRAFAQETIVPNVTAKLVFNGAENFLDIQYSLDGEQWKSVDNANLELPLVNTDEMRQVKIRIVSLRGGEDLPEVYLDNLWLEAEYVPEDNAPVEGETQTAEADQAAPGIVENIVEAVSAIPEAVQEFFSPDNTAAPQVAATTESNNQAVPPPAAPEFRFNLSGRQGLPDDGASESGQEETNVRVGDGNKSLFLEGPCSSQYYTVLLFAGSDDYRKDPARALLNRAELCQSGSYSFELTGKDLPPELPDGAYYLLPAEQEETQPWRPGRYMFNVEIRKNN